MTEAKWLNVAMIIIAALVLLVLMLIVEIISLKKKAKKNIGTLYIKDKDVYCEFNIELDEIEKLKEASITIYKA